MLSLSSLVHADSALFETDDLLELTLVFDLEAIQNDRGEDPSYHKAFLICESGEPIELKVKARGNFRLRKDVCQLPPLKLNFAKNSLKNPIFKGQNKLKLVTNCQGEDYVLQEYMIYKTFSLLTENSFKVRLARITYKDSQGKHEPETHYSFFIEDAGQMARRIGGFGLVEERMKPEELEAKSSSLIYVFQTLIGNSDWDFTLQKNIKLVAMRDGTSPVPVPYDFDWAGVVEAPYSLPFKDDSFDFKDRDVREIPCDQHCLEEVRALFINRKEQIYQQYKKCPYLDSKIVKRTLSFFDQFYKVIGNPKKSAHYFLSQL